MSWKEWTAVSVVIGAGILLQIPGHDDAQMDHEAMGHGDMPAQMATATATGVYRTVVLDVTGMT